MRRVHATGGLVLAALAIATSAPALGQAGQPSVYDYACKLTPEACIDADTPSDAKDRKEQRTFSLTRNVSGKPHVIQVPSQVRGRGGLVARNVSIATSSQPAPEPGRRRRPSLGVSNGDMMMTFLNGSAELTSQAKTNATVLAKVMNTGLAASKRFAIEGHTNAVGSAESNYKLSQARADALKTFLVASGVDASRLETKGYGFDRILPGRPKEAAANRRVEAKAIS